MTLTQNRLRSPKYLFPVLLNTCYLPQDSKSAFLRVVFTWTLAWEKLQFKPDLMQRSKLNHGEVWDKVNPF